MRASANVIHPPDDEGRKAIKSFAAQYQSAISFMPVEGRVYFVRDPTAANVALCQSEHSALHSLMVLTTLDSDRALLLIEYLSCARTMSSYLASVVTGSFDTMCTIL